ncbi:sec-independent translocase [Streptomyces palmae]|uniref:Sec-independent protein translocase protein TatB n=1 Tax=Streptomyces palmae TaxID=1701085 RepID=A0A4Z0H8D1_9ACTN|nr:sec-independent translocase [Streptomyces palmae]TGB08901.1 Sec-independent protein translocase subunit TatB [Streptomyces palmae]
MFFDIGPLEMIAIVILAVLVFGPEKLPKVIQDVTGFLRKVREFSDSAKQDIRSELGPEFKDFEFEDLNPKTFARKHLLDKDKDEYGLRELASSFDLRKEMAEVADAVNGRPSDPVPSAPAAGGTASGGSDLLRKRDTPAPAERPPFDADAT